MKNIFTAIWAESLKIYRSKMLWATILVYLFIPFMLGMLMFVQKYPEISAKMGMIGTKASMLTLGETNWSTYFGFLNLVIAMMGIMGFGFVTTWVFSREFSDETVRDLLALPTSRSCIVLSKFIVTLIWCLLLSFILFAFGLIVGGMIQLSGWSSEIVFHSAYIFIVTSFLTILLCTPVAFFASYGRGYLPPIGFVILTLIISQFIGLVGLGPYFPWAIPALYSGAAGAKSAQLGMISYIILFLTSIFGLIGTLAWWRYADQY
jgi:ABC-2 type transport system permease protein